MLDAVGRGEALRRSPGKGGANDFNTALQDELTIAHKFTALTYLRYAKQSLQKPEASLCDCKLRGSSHLPPFALVLIPLVDCPTLNSLATAARMRGEDDISACLQQRDSVSRTSRLRGTLLFPQHTLTLPSS